MRLPAVAAMVWVCAISFVGCDRAVLEKTHESRVVDVRGDQLTVEPTRPGSSEKAKRETIRVDPAASITRDGKGARLEDLEPGDYVNVRTTGDGADAVAMEIDAHPAKGDRPPTGY